MPRVAPILVPLPGNLVSPGVEPTVLLGDAYDLFSRIAPESVDLVITSPPYWGHRSYGLSHNWDLLNDIEKVRKIGTTSPGWGWYRENGGVLGLEPYPEWYVQHLTEIFSKARRCLKADGNIWINIGDTYFARWASIREGGRQGLGDPDRLRRKTPMGGFRQEKQLLMVPARFAIAMQNDGWILRNDMIWHKPNTPPRPEEDRLKLAHEHFFHFVKKPKEGRAKYYYNVEFAEFRANDVVTCTVRAGEADHSATFPAEIVEPRILTSSPPGGTVLDPFCGTGRALEVAQRHGRRVVGFEISKKYWRTTTSKLAGGGDMAAPKGKTTKKTEEKNNVISEWYGHRIYPQVRIPSAAIAELKKQKCPFLSRVLSESTKCIKAESSSGVCTINSTSNGPRQDWLACPFRVIDSDIVSKSTRVIFGLDVDVAPVAASKFTIDGELAKFKRTVDGRGKGYVFYQQKLGGEISVPATEKSPEMSFDVVIAEIVRSGDSHKLSRYGILEIQTMDFHGTYSHAVKDLADALRLHSGNFPEELDKHKHWASKKVEGPNIANVFKRTFYQMMLKFQFASKGSAAGTALAVPQSVWDSWQRFLGGPEYRHIDGIFYRMTSEDPSGGVLPNAHICVFDLDAESRLSPSPVEVKQFVRLSAEQLAHHALNATTEAALHSIDGGDAILVRVFDKIKNLWPDLQLP